jgi:RimJ/RimL family protein N-acetyltransferase
MVPGKTVVMIASIHRNSDARDKEMFLAAYSRIWNHPDNLVYLSTTSIAFTDEQMLAWLNDTEENGMFKYFCFPVSDTFAGIIVAKYDIVNGAEILGLGIHPDHKGQSIGACLLDHAIYTASGLGFQSISTTVFADNIRMQRLLLGRHFRPVSIEHEKRHDGMSLVTYKRYGLKR